jgi:hypothetical protein
MNEKEARQSSREATAIRTSLARVWILHYASAARFDTSALLEQLRVHDCEVSSKAAKALLGGMIRNGWLKLNVARAGIGDYRVYSLTARGWLVLRTAKQHLEELASTGGGRALQVRKSTMREIPCK